MPDCAVPVVLVHGWKSHPGIWNRLVPRLCEAGIPVWSFDYTSLDGAAMEEVAGSLGGYIAEQRADEDYSGRIDLVCHSIGSCVARFLLEVTDGRTRNENVGRLIAIGPPNNGSALAELFCNPVIGPEITARLTGTFVPQNFDPAADVMVRACRPESATMKTLRAAGTRPDIACHVICAENRTGTPAFFPCLGGKTFVLLPGGRWEMTCAGDGIVPLVDSVLPGATLDVLPASPLALRDNPAQYCHLQLPRAPEVVERVMEYLCRNPATGAVNRSSS